MPQKYHLQSYATRLSDKFKSLLNYCGAVCLFLICAGILLFTFDGYKAVLGSKANQAFMYAFIGLLALFYYRSIVTFGKIVALVFGLLFFTVALLLGLTWPLALFFGGIQAWVLRCIYQKAKMGEEWITCLLFIPGIIKYYEICTFLPAAKSVFLIFPLLTCVGVCTFFIVQTFFFIPHAKRQIQKTLTLLKQTIDSNILPLPLKLSTKKLVSMCTVLLNNMPKRGETVEIIVQVLQKITNKIQVIDLNKSWAKNGDSILFAVNMLCKEVEEQLLRQNTPFVVAEEKNLQTKDTKEATFITLDQKIQKLRREKDTVPYGLAATIDSLCDTAESIVQTMRTDPNDYEPGKKFLKKYLPIADKVLSEFTRLHVAPVEKDDALNHVFTQSAEMLQRLEKAFKKEYRLLLANDARGLNAELLALDALLKMDGR